MPAMTCGMSEDGGRTDKPYGVRRLTPQDGELFAKMLDLFGDVFEDRKTYYENRPSQLYVEQLLANTAFVALIICDGDEVIGALTAYELPKFEQERSEFHIYDLAVAEAHRRKGIASALISAVCVIARERGAHLVFVQADYGDDPAIALYTKLGQREEVIHFDIPLNRGAEAETGQSIGPKSAKRFSDKSDA